MDVKIYLASLVAMLTVFAGAGSGMAYQKRREGLGLLLTAVWASGALLVGLLLAL